MNRKTLKSGVPCFKRWSRKRYGVFASIGREVNIGVLSVSMFILTFATDVALAQSDTVVNVPRVELEAIKVEAQRVNPTRGLATPLSVYSRKQFSNSPLPSIESALKVNPAVDLRERGARGVQADISLFGGSTDQTMIMLNGVNFTDARTGHQSHALPVDIEAVSDIDLIGGISGIGAFTGALNIVTTPLKPNYLRTEICGGQHGYLYTNISGAATRNNLSAMVIGSLRKSNGYKQNTDFKNVNLFTRVNYDCNKLGFIDFQAGYQNKYFGANGFYSLAYPNQAEQTETFLSSIRWVKRLKNNIFINSTMSYRQNLDRFELFRNGVGAATWYKGHNYHKTDNFGCELYVDYLWCGGKTSIGSDYTYNALLSSLLGDSLEMPEEVPGEINILYIKGKTRNVVNGWLRHTLLLGKINIAGSANFAHSPYGNNVLWSMATEYKSSDAFLLFANATQSMRLPTFTDLYYTNSTHIANTNLSPERALTFKIGAEYRKTHFMARLSTYYRKGNHIIDWVKESFEAKWQSMQITSLNTFGGDIYLSYVSDHFINELSLSYSHVQTNKNSAHFISKYAFDYLRDKLALHSKFQIHKNITLNMINAWYKRNGTFEITKDNVQQYKPYWMVDAKLNWKIENISLYIDASNILNRKHYDFGGLELPGIWVTSGIVLTI